MNRLLDLIADLVRIPSENTPPTGAESACQNYIADSLRRLGLAPDVYSPIVARDHPLYWPGRDYTGRSNVAARLGGAGGGRSLILSGHIDTVPVGWAPWKHGPFAAHRDAARMYGRGVWDMKAGVATALWVFERLREEGVTLRGDLIFESVVDEEFGGVNGTLAGRVRGYLADGAVIGEPSKLRVLPAQRGGRLFHITFESGGDIFANEHGPLATAQLTRFLARLPEFEAARLAAAPRHPMYPQENPVPVFVTNIQTSQWGPREPVAIPSSCRLELYYETMPGETQADVERQFHDWLAEVASDRALFPAPPRVERPIRFLPGSFTPASHPFVEAFADTAAGVLGSPPPVQGIEAPCDMYVFHEFGMPALLWGARGGNAHLPDEYLETESAVTAANVLYEFVLRWCGVA